MKVWIERDELWPVFSIRSIDTHPVDMAYGALEADLPEEFIARYKKMNKEFSDVNWKLRTIWEAKHGVGE